MFHIHNWSEWRPYSEWVMTSETGEEFTYVDTWYTMCLTFPCSHAILRDRDGQFLPGDISGTEFAE